MRRAVLVGVTAAAVAGAILFVGGWSTSGGLADSVSVDWKDRSRTYNDLTLVAPHGGTQILWVAMDGQVVKKLHTPWTVSLAEQLPTGNILMLAGGAVRELDGDGKIVWQYKPRQGIAHHEVLRTPRGTTFTLIMDHDRTLDLWYDIIVEVDRKGSVVWEWNSLDHLDTRIDREPLDPPHKFLGVTDWLHANSIGLFPNGDILLSLRNLNRLLRIDYPSGEIIWSWGEGILGHQHSAQVLENGNILLFDNGFHQTTDRPCAKQPCASRALEVDPRTGTIIWSYERQGYFSFAFGDADRLPNGNTLVTFGQQKPEAVVIEVTPQGDVVWTLTSKIRTLVPPVTGDKEVATLYRAQRVEQVPKSVR